jgi:putative hydrolase of the HAD superfamily
MLSPNGIKAILFDLDGTLRLNRPDGAEVFIDQAVALGLPIRLDDRLRGIRWEHYYWANSPELRNDFKDYGGDASPDFWLNYGRRQLVALGAASVRARELAPALSHYMNDSYKPASVLADAAAGILREFKDAGFKLGVVSNRELPFGEEVERLEISSFFDFLLAAGEVQLYKPDPGIFRAALERVGVQPEAAMYVGDNYFADVVGSQRAGLHPVLYDPRGVYPSAVCDVIQAFGQLPGLLK